VPSPFRALADSIARTEAVEARARFQAAVGEQGLAATDEAVDLAALLSCAYPSMAPSILAHPEDVVAIARGTKLARDARAYRRSALTIIGDVTDNAGVRRGLRRFAHRERLRIAARELLPYGADIDVTARELADLADVCIELALGEAMHWADARFGEPRTSEGARCRFVVIGMGKLGGRELNSGSDVDLLLFYETDDGEAVKDGVSTSLHEYFTRVSQRFTATLGDVTEDGFAWRVDLRLRPEGARGPLVNSLAAAERYYETWGRTWERAALVRARAVAGDLKLGHEALAALAPFVWRREVNPAVADEMIALVVRARAETPIDPERDLKLGVGGIREVEFFVQSLQLIWGGREPSVRATNTLDAVRRLRARGLVTDREGRETADAYLALRRLEHRVQFAIGWQTHALPVPARSGSRTSASWTAISTRRAAACRRGSDRCRAKGASRRTTRERSIACSTRSTRGTRRRCSRGAPASSARRPRRISRVTSSRSRAAPTTRWARRRATSFPSWRRCSSKPWKGRPIRSRRRA